ncbi:MAG TPA: hypothetical protein VFA94_16795 [Acidimicrobiales bacterium]|nr:hypothetical protein [Acidimicrobiales bacterium]
MGRRAVTQVRRGPTGEIIAVSDPGQPWAPRARDDVVADTVSGEHTYYVPWPEGDMDIMVIEDASGPRLHTNRRPGSGNDLLTLPECP